MGALLGLDYGDVRIGVAISDPLPMIAQTSGYIDNISFADVVAAIKDRVEHHHIIKIVIGLPLKLDGTDSIQTQKTRDFIAELEKKISLPIVSFDERLTTAYAQSLLISSGMRRKKRKKKVDGLAAQIMLQNYIDRYHH